ncbi:MAG: hypothetical protein DSZ08_02045, partial [Sulfurovum sp.]
VEKEKNFKSYQNIDDSIPQYFEMDSSQVNAFRATLGAKVMVHFYNQRKDIDESRALMLSLALEQNQQIIHWDDAKIEEEDFEKFPYIPPSEASFQALPEVVLEDKGLKKAIRELKETLYREEKLTLFRCLSPKMESKVDESEGDFRVRVQDVLDDKKEQEIEKLQQRYDKKEKTLLERERRAKERVEKESSDSTNSMIETGIAVLGALFGRTSPTKIGRAFKKGSTILKERGDMSRAEERLVAVQDDLDDLSQEFEDAIDTLNEKYSVDNCKIETFTIKPRKTDIDVELCAVVWRVS